MATKKLTQAELERHKEVIRVVEINLDLVINQLESLDNGKYDATLEVLDSAKTELKKAS